MKCFLRWVSLSYLLGLAVLLLTLRWAGESSFYTGPTLYFPPYIWMLPGVPLALIALLFDRSMAVIWGFVLLWFGVSYLGFRWHRPLPREAGDLTVISCNLGRIAPASTMEAF